MEHSTECAQHMVQSTPTTTGVVVRATASLSLLLLLLLVIGGVGYEAYLASREPPPARPRPVSPAIARRAVFFIIDGFHPERAFDPTVMPSLVRLAATGASGIVR